MENWNHLGKIEAVSKRLGEIHAEDENRQMREAFKDLVYEESRLTGGKRTYLMKWALMRIVELENQVRS